MFYNSMIKTFFPKLLCHQCLFSKMILLKSPITDEKENPNLEIISKAPMNPWDARTWCWIVPDVAFRGWAQVPPGTGGSNGGGPDGWSGCAGMADQSVRVSRVCIIILVMGYPNERMLEVVHNVLNNLREVGPWGMPSRKLPWLMFHILFDIP